MLYNSSLFGKSCNFS